MEKFGIFELLDALSALSGMRSDTPEDTKENAPASAPPAPVGDARAEAGDASGTPQATQPPRTDRVSPQSRGAQADAAPQTLNEQDRNARALSDFLARHERIRKNAEKNK